MNSFFNIKVYYNRSKNIVRIFQITVLKNLFGNRNFEILIKITTVAIELLNINNISFFVSFISITYLYLNSYE